MTKKEREAIEESQCEGEARDFADRVVGAIRTVFGFFERLDRRRSEAASRFAARATMKGGFELTGWHVILAMR